MLMQMSEKAGIHKIGEKDLEAMVKEYMKYKSGPWEGIQSSPH